MRCFMLQPTRLDPYGKAARHALCKFADHIQSVNPEMARDLRQWVIEIEANDVQPSLFPDDVDYLKFLPPGGCL